MNLDWNLMIASFSAIAASAASIATFLGWKENRELRKVQTEPLIDIKLEPVEYRIHFLRLKITNVGKGGAHNVKIKLFPEPSLDASFLVTAQKAIKVFMQRDFMIKGVNYLAPNDSKYTDYLSFTGLNPKELDSEYFFNLIFNAEIRYEDLKGKKYKNTYKIDTSELKIYKLGESFEEALPKTLAGIQKSLESMSKNINRQTAFLDKKSKVEETHWNEYELKQKLNYMSYVKRRNRELDIDQDAYLFKKIERRLSIHEIRRKNK